MPNFVQPPALTQYMLETCQDACQVVTSLDDYINALNSVLNDLVVWFNSTSFPNVLYDSTTGKFSFYEDGQLKEIPNMPNVVLKDGLLSYVNDTNTLSDVPAASLKDAVFYDGTQAEYLRRSTVPGTGQAVMPFVGCVRYHPDSGWEFHNGTVWQTIEIRPTDGALFLVNDVIKMYQKATDSYIEVQLPHKNGDVKADSGYLWKYKDGLWSKFFYEGQVRATTDGSALEVYRNGTWSLLHTFN